MSVGRSMCVVLSFLCACSPEVPGEEGARPGDGRASGDGASGAVVRVPPSGDPTGLADADAIEEALRAAAPGDVVRLTDGDESTVDRYHVSRGLVLPEGFAGTLEGEGPESTVVEAVAPSGGGGFEPAIDSRYVSVPDDPEAGVWPTLLHFEYPRRAEVRGLTLTRSVPLAPETYFQYVAVWGGDHEVRIHDLSVDDPEESAWTIGVHVMGGSATGELDGRARVEVVRVTSRGLGAHVLAMWYGAGSAITIAENRAEEGGAALWLEGIEAAATEVRDNAFTRTGPATMQLRAVRGATIADNAFVDLRLPAWWAAGIYARHGVHDGRIAGNTFEGVRFTGEAGSRGSPAAIHLRGLEGGEERSVSGTVIEDNDWSRSGLTGGPDGPGAVRLGAFTRGNRIDERTLSPDALCRMIRDETDDETTPAYDGANVVAGRRCGGAP